MKKYIFKFLLLIMAVGLSTNLASQNVNRNKQTNKDLMSRQEFMNKRTAFIIKESGLTQKEAKTFLTVWDELHQRQMKINDDINDRIEKASKDGLENEQEYQNLIKRMSDSKIEKANLDKEYTDKVLEIIPATKLFKVLGAEMAFRRRIFKEYGHEKSRHRDDRNPE
ncbi:MAG: hypothetical protein WCR36_01205 [Bacteroidaceae bacterium]